MTVFITHCWKKSLERIVLLCAVLLLGTALAGDIETRRATIAPDERGWAVSAEFDVQIGARLEEAVRKGVPLHFRFEVQIKRKRWYWIDEHVAGRVLQYRLSYQALTRQYRLTIGGHLHQNYDSLDEALAALGRIARLNVTDRTALRPGEPLTAAVRLSLDHTQLPKPLQIDALADRDWRVEASTHTWQFTPVPEQ
ncbi:MAG: DUF4390 domain-containing protein [Sulfuritalea sp.]|nr:DUF4390 domain-containing protein [Sulfuritalea sp.]